MSSDALPPDPEAAQDAPEQQQRVNVQFDDSGAAVCYANFCRVSRSPEEIILDVGLNPHPGGGVPAKVTVAQRIVMNPYTAKRLLGALNVALRQHEQTFGEVQVDVRKRVVNQG
ncbi:DUF3467 domain-containing protein [Alienimonas californiensis]|uniref:DUF3467 domain-containing protein n=1 Tax=Alienimonas californiensis TaxID=2527989 RepID=A0A517P7L8_9PLAN|nr:DUF3467 domain-containing protein [Alienimonas californiensis]QDT15360.1 hypothetical protein CA12_14450 [Alienimonas californiensis]